MSVMELCSQKNTWQKPWLHYSMITKYPFSFLHFNWILHFIKNKEIGNPVKKLWILAFVTKGQIGFCCYEISWNFCYENLTLEFYEFYSFSFWLEFYEFYSFSFWLFFFQYQQIPFTYHTSLTKPFMPSPIHVIGCMVFSKVAKIKQD